MVLDLILMQQNKVYIVIEMRIVTFFSIFQYS